MDRRKWFLLAVLVVAIALAVVGASCRDGGSEAPPTASPATLPTETLRPTLEPFKLPTAVPFRTVTAPDAATAGRSDCPADWVAYTDPQDRYSICYPSEFGDTESDFAFYAAFPSSVDQNFGASVNISWSGGAGQFYGPPSPETCDDYTGGVLGTISSEFVEVTLGDRQVPACFTIGPTGSSLYGSITLAEDKSDRAGFIHFSFSFVDPDLSRVPQLGVDILETLSVNFR